MSTNRKSNNKVISPNNSQSSNVNNGNNSSNGSKKSNSRFNDVNNKQLSDRVIPSFNGRQSTMLEFFPTVKSSEITTKRVTITEEDEDGSLIATTTTTTTTTTSQKLISPSSSQRQRQQSTSTSPLNNSNNSNSNGRNNGNGSTGTNTPQFQSPTSSQQAPLPSSSERKRIEKVIIDLELHQQKQQQQTNNNKRKETDDNTNATDCNQLEMDRIGKRMKQQSDQIQSNPRYIECIEDDDLEVFEPSQSDDVQPSNRTTTKQQRELSIKDLDQEESDQEIENSDQEEQKVEEQEEEEEEEEDQYSMSASQQNDNNDQLQNYYLKDFLLVTETVYKRDKHLFSKEEVDFIDTFLKRLSPEAKCLFVRIYNRKGPWFQVSNIKYKEIKNINQCIDELIKFKLFIAYDTNTHDYNDISPLLQVARLKKILGPSCPSTSSKHKLLELISGGGGRQKTSSQNDNTNSLFSIITVGNNNNNNKNQTMNRFKTIVEETIGKCIKINEFTVKLWQMAHHLFFFSWNLHNAQTIIVTDIMGITYPPYRVNNEPSNSIFRTRQNLLDYENVRDIQNQLEYIYENQQENNLKSILEKCSTYLTSTTPHDKLEHNFALKFTPGYIYSRVLTDGIAILERQKQHQDAIFYLMILLESPYCIGKRGHWWLRLIINLKHLKEEEKAKIICTQALIDKHVKSGDRLALENQYLSFLKSKKNNDINILKDPLITLIHTLKQPKEIVMYYEKVENGLPGRKCKFYIDDDEQDDNNNNGKSSQSGGVNIKKRDTANVEGAALDYYSKKEGWSGIHCETSLFITFFILFLWDIVFCSDIPYVFQSPYQDAPLDFGDDQFYYARKQLIDDRISELELSNGEERQVMLEKVWENQSCKVRGINWDKYSLEQLCEISNSLGGKLIGYCCRLLSEDYKCFSHGMPDLFLWKKNPNIFIEESHYIKFVEVKSENDSLSSQQKVWIDHLITFGCEVEKALIKNK